MVKFSMCFCSYCCAATAAAAAAAVSPVSRCCGAGGVDNPVDPIVGDRPRLHRKLPFLPHEGTEIYT